MIDVVLEDTNFKPYGYLGYHEQDLMRAVNGEGLFLWFGAFKESGQTRASGRTKTEAGHWYKALLEAKGLTVEWDGDAEQRLQLTNFSYEVPFDDDGDYSYERCLEKFENIE